MIRLSKQVFKRWARIVNRLTIDEAVEILLGLKTDYLEEWITIYYGGKQHSGALDTLARQNMGYLVTGKRWQDLSCQFIGGPDGMQTFTATVRTYVLDCLIQEIHKYDHMPVYSVVYKVLKRKNRTLCLFT